MTEKIKRINNPLTIIAIFAALAEVNATVALGLIDPELQNIFIWFVIGFPSLLVLLFFITLNFNTKVMYSPSDYKDDKSFIDSLFGAKNYYGNQSKEDSDALVQMEKKFTDQINSKFEEISTTIVDPSIKTQIEDLKTDINKLANSSMREAVNEIQLSTELKQKLLNLYQFPAYYILLNVIAKTNPKSIDRFSKLTERYYVPEGWENGALDSLLTSGFLIGDLENFEINPEYLSQLRQWLNANRMTLELLSRNMKVEKEVETEEEKVRIQAKIQRLIGRIKI